jgi:hypothetical protein
MTACIKQIHVCGVGTACLNCHDAHDVVTHLIAWQLVANSNPRKQPQADIDTLTI